jgi:hypothetical protein
MFRIEVDDKAFRLLLKDLVPQFRQELSRQLLGFGRHVQRLVKDEIRGGTTPPPLGIQRVIKGHSSTLLETGELASAVNWKYVFGAGRRFGGVEVKVDGPKKKIAAILHEGTGPWVPDEYQRRAVYAKLPPGTYIGPKKPFWMIPSRPFMRNALDKEEVVRKFAQSVSRAINSTIRKYGSSGGGGSGGGGA